MKPNRPPPRTYVLQIKTHKLSIVLAADKETTVGSLKTEVLSALQAPVLDAPAGPTSMHVDEDPEWAVPKITGVGDFELSRALKERGRPTGRYEVLDTATRIQSALTNWEYVFVQFRDENGTLQPVKVSLPALLDEDEEDQEAALAAARKGKRKADMVEA
ncbi:hypothetical protein OBBRIDRAFT_795378 [Obba rivulosa]|uniref:Uncharacterized protein n=1 Tax=Obba rivulosa TaxID=1052685 RepID=A0A8E2AU04_9APHY|nr:hypothetical protein OBBRIDRAFT_795378 [Obba rivulosa]